MSGDDRNDMDAPSENEGALSRLLSALRTFLDNHERVFNLLSTTITAVFTAVLATSTVLLWKETRDLRNFAQEQEVDTQKSIHEAARAAAAMEQVATAMAANTKSTQETIALYKDANIRQMRAYLTVSFGSVIPQDLASNYRFEVRMVLQNVGNTPAYSVLTEAHVDVLPFPLPLDYNFLKSAGTNSSATVVGPHQNFILTGVAPQLYSDSDVSEIKTGLKKRLYVYGTVAYEDAFGIKRYTNFSHAINWLKNSGFMTFTTPNHNDAD